MEKDFFEIWIMDMRPANIQQFANLITQHLYADRENNQSVYLAWQVIILCLFVDRILHHNKVLTRKKTRHITYLNKSFMAS